MELSSRTSSERYNPITGTPVPVHPTRPNTSAIFGGSPGAIEYMFIPPSATTRPTIPNTTEKRRSLSRESLRRSFTTAPESLPDSDECSSMSDLSECSSEAEHRDRTRTNSGTFSKTRKPVARSASSRLPVSASKPTVMKRANSFTRGTDSCIPRGQACDSRGSTNQQEANSTSDLSTQPRRSSVGETSKIPRKKAARGAGPQSSRISLKRADVNSNDRERPGEEITGNKRTAPANSKNSGIAVNTSNKQTSSEFKKPSEPVVSKQNAVSGIPVKGGKIQQHSGNSRISSTKQDGSGPRGNVASKHTEQIQNIDKENDDIKSAMQAGKSTLKREGTGDELRVGKNDVTKSKLPRKSNIPKSNVTKTSQQKTRNIPNTEVETKNTKTNQTSKNKGTSLSDNKTNVPNAYREPSSGPAETLGTSYTLQRSDSGYGDTDSVSSKEDAPVTEPGNEFTLSRENSKSKIPIMSSKSRGGEKPSRDAPSSDEKKPKTGTKKAEGNTSDANELLHAARVKLEAETGINNENDIKTSARKSETDTVTSETDNIWVYKNGTSQNVQEHKNILQKKVENFINKTKTDNHKTSSKENLVSGLGTNKGAVVTSKTESRGLPNKDVEKGIETCDQLRDKSGSFNRIEGFATRESTSNNEKVSMTESNVGLQKSENQIQDGEFSENERETRNANTKQSLDNLRNLDGEAGSKIALKDTKAGCVVYKQPTVDSEKEMVARKTTAKQSPKKPPRLSKLLVKNDSENKFELSIAETRKENVEVLSNQQGNLGKEDPSAGDGVVNKAGTRQPGDVGDLEGVRTLQDMGQVKEVRSKVKEDPSRVQEIPSMGDMLRGTGQFGGVVEASVGQGLDLEEVGGEDKNDPPRRSDNCMQCRMEQSMSDGEDMPKLEDDPGFRQYPTFISPRKSLVMCKHHAKQKNDMEISREQPLVAMTSLADAKNDQKSSLEPLQPDPTSKILNLSSQESNEEVTKTVGVKSPIGEKSRRISPVSNNAERLSNTTRNGINRSESLKTPKNGANESRQVDSKTLPGPKGNHSPLLALSRDKKFAQNTKPTEDIKTALSLEWDDTGTELRQPNFSDDDEGPGSKPGDLEDTRRPSVKLMNTNEALDKLKVIQSLIMKEAESRSRKESEESAGKYAVGVKKTGNESVEGAGSGKKTGAESVESAGKYSKKSENEVANFGGKYGVSESNSNQVSPTLEAPGRESSSPTIWDRITDNSTISQDQTTELLNETLAKLKASPKLSSNVLAKRTLSSRSLPGSRQASKEQLLSDSERPVYVYTSSWMNTSGKNSRGSTLSLCSNNRSLPSSRQNLTKEPAFNGLKRSESAAGRMEKENGKRLEPKERKEFRLSDFDEINLSDDMSELRSQKATTPHLTPGVDRGSDNEKQLKKSKRSKKKSKNTTATMNNLPAYGVSMDDLADGKTKCQCGGNKCVIS